MKNYEEGMASEPSGDEAQEYEDHIETLTGLYSYPYKVIDQYGIEPNFVTSLPLASILKIAHGRSNIDSVPDEVITSAQRVELYLEGWSEVALLTNRVKPQDTMRDRDVHPDNLDRYDLAVMRTYCGVMRTLGVGFDDTSLRLKKDWLDFLGIMIGEPAAMGSPSSDQIYTNWLFYMSGFAASDAVPDFVDKIFNQTSFLDDLVVNANKKLSEDGRESFSEAETELMREQASWLFNRQDVLSMKYADMMLMGSLLDDVTNAFLVAGIEYHRAEKMKHFISEMIDVIVYQMKKALDHNMDSLFRANDQNVVALTYVENNQAAIEAETAELLDAASDDDEAAS